MDRGFELMLPHPIEKEEKRQRYIFRQNISFTLFNREFRFYLSVKPTE